MDRYLFYRDNVPARQLQTIGTAALFIAAKMEEVTPADLHRLVEFGDGAVVIDDLIRIVSMKLIVTSFFFSDIFFLRLPHYRIRQTIAQSTRLDE